MAARETGEVPDEEDAEVLDGLIERLPDGILVVRDGYVVLANARARDLLGCPDPVGEPVTARVQLFDDAGIRIQLPGEPPAVGDRYAERVLHLAVPGGSRPIAFAGRWSDGDLVLTMRNAGRREAAVRSQADVVATVAHEIRSPLTSVKGFTRTLLSRWDRFSDEQKHTMLTTIEADADRVTRLLTDLLDVARIDAGRVKLRRVELDVVELVGSVIEKGRIRAPDRTFEVAVDGEVPRILGDADKLEQVLTNLVDNALEHAPRSPIRCQVAPEGDGVRITVTDEGPGVDPGIAPRLFTKFARGRSDHGAGTGLGLYLTKGLVEAHGGTIAFDPEVEHGASVSVWLPAGLT